MISLTPLNFRYYLFEFNSKFFIVDRKPEKYYLFFFLPINFIIKKSVYEISQSEYNKILTIPKKNNFVIPTSIIIGLTVLLSGMIRKYAIVEYFESNLQTSLKLTVILISVLISYIITEMTFSFFKTNLNVMAILKDKEKKLCRIKPQKNCYYLKSMFAYLIIWIITLCEGLVFFIYGNLFFVGGMIFTFFCLFISVNLIYNNELKYKVEMEV